MSSIDVEKLLQPLSDDAPCGEDLEYDEAFIELERSSQITPERQMGEEIIPAEEPRWPKVRSAALELSGRTQDLRVTRLLTQALVRIDGVPGLADALALMRGQLDRHWESVHPKLDPDDDNDPTQRINTLTSLCSPEFLDAVRRAPLVTMKGIGSFSFRDLEIVGGRMSPSAGEDRPPAGAVDAAFMECPLEELQALDAALGTAVEQALAIEAVLTEKVGLEQSTDLSALPNQLKEMQPGVAEKLARRGIVAEGAEAAAPGQAAAQPMAGEITSREDIMRMLDKACEFLLRTEPSSPVPMLLQRAKKLISKDFMEILKDLAPGGVKEAQIFRGPDD